jgi:hypothetical protein
MYVGRKKAWRIWRGNEDITKLLIFSIIAETAAAFFATPVATTQPVCRIQEQKLFESATNATSSLLDVIPWCSNRCSQ